MQKLFIGLVPALATAVAVAWMAPSVAGASSGYYGPDGFYNELAYVDPHGREIFIDHRGRYFSSGQRSRSIRACGYDLQARDRCARGSFRTPSSRTTDGPHRPDGSSRPECVRPSRAADATAPRDPAP